MKWWIILILIVVGPIATAIWVGKVQYSAGYAKAQNAIDSLENHVALLEESVAIKPPYKESIIYVPKPIAAKKDTQWFTKWVFDPDSFGTRFPGAMLTISYNRPLGKAVVVTYGGTQYEIPEKIGSFFIRGDTGFFPVYEPLPEEPKKEGEKTPFIYGNMMCGVEILPSWKTINAGDSSAWKYVSDLRASFSPGLVIGRFVRIGAVAGVSYTAGFGWSPFVGAGATVKLTGRW